MNQESLSFSIVICTYNRDLFLERTLRSLSHLEYSNFEVVVVNGPSTDRTAEILETYACRIKIENNPVANLSISRNLGIAAASGDVIAFLDDDAIPEPNWLHQIAELYRDHDTIGGAGGRVYGPGSDHFQFHNGIIDVWGEAEAKRERPGNFTDPNGLKFNIMMGVNSTFLRSSLMVVGGFDEYYEYFHDESDLCLRLTRAGHPIYHHEEAYVHHEFARSHIRRTIYHLNWYPIVKNTVYFGVKNSKGLRGLAERLVRPFLTARKRVSEFKLWLRDGNITKNDYHSFMKMWWRGAWRGYVDGFFKERPLRFDMKISQPFVPYKKEHVEELDPAILLKRDKAQQVEPQKEALISQNLGICLLSRYYPPFGKGGVATYTKALAEGLASKGHTVYVLTTGVTGGDQVINGVHVRNIMPTEEDQGLKVLQDYGVTKNNVAYSMQAAHEIERLREHGLISIVESPLWDYEGLATTQNDQIKTVVRLETPLRKAAQMQNWPWNADLELSAELEKRLMQEADGVITISRNVQQTIGELYGIDWSNREPDLVPLGLFRQEDLAVPPTFAVREERALRILFVGRLEPRKGVDVLLRAFAQVAKKHTEVELMLAGNNQIPFADGQTIQQIFERNADADVLSRVHFLGEVSDEHLMELYEQCDLFVAPSRYESFGLVYLEAMSQGKPVIGTRTGGVPEVVSAGRTGLLVEPADDGDLARALETLLLDPQLRHQLGKQAYQAVVDEFTVEKMVERTLEVYRRILSL